LGGLLLIKQGSKGVRIANNLEKRRKQMADKKVTVVARIKTKAGMEEKVRQELVSLQVPTRSEPGCINYDIHQSVDDKSLFLLYENWASKDDLDKHFEMPYLKAWREKAKDLVAAPTEVSFWEMIS